MPSTSARIAFGVFVLPFAVVSIVWHDADLRQFAAPLGPAAGAAAWALTIAQCAGGVGLLLPQTVRLASLVLVGAYAFEAVGALPGIVQAPATNVQYEVFAEHLAPVCGALAAYATLDPRGEAFARAARMGLGLCAFQYALAQIFYLAYTASLVPAWLPLGQIFWTNLTTIAFFLAAIGLFVNRNARLAAQLLAVMLAAFGVLVWVPHIVAQPRDLSQWNEITENCLIAAAAWLVAAVCDNPPRRA